MPLGNPVLAVPGPSAKTVVTSEEIADFAPTIIANFAFLTRERVADLGEASFVATNRELMNRFERYASSPTVRGALTVSSGAAVTEPEHPYGRMKAEEEERAASLTTVNRSVVVMRTYSVSGPYVRRPRDYAFSNMICQSMEGVIRIESAAPVFRRYCSVADAITVAMRSIGDGRSGVFETGGPLVEMGELAESIRDAVAPRARILRDLDPAALEQHYHSDNVSWREWSSAVALEPADLTQQIRLVAAKLLPHQI